MKITERDIFNFIYFRNELDLEKLNYIQQNYNSFSESIELYSTIKENIDNPIDGKTSNNIHWVIESQYIIELYPKPINSNYSNQIRFAADSATLENKSSVNVFTDADEKYLIRILSSKSGRAMYIFSASGEQLVNFDVILFPSQKHYHIENNNSPILIDDDVEFEKIQIKFLK